jgi:UDP-N-acetylmuramoyl-tripeptide--D-alanyl-D-alanine ligase
MTGTNKALWTAAEAVDATGGQSTRDWSAKGISIDTRSLAPSDLFVALQGPNFDGHDFLAAAFEKGATAAMVQCVPEGRAAEHPMLLVDDTLGALWRLGAASRSRASAKVLAVTGSVGKTGSKEALRHCLSRQAETIASLASLNNHWGVPLSLARMPADAAYGVFELGMNAPGEILELARLTRPEVALITTIAPAHIGNFESLFAIADAKAEIFQAMDGGTAILNRDHALFHYLRDKAETAGIERIFGFGQHHDAEARLVDFHLDSEGSKVEVQIRGKKLKFQLKVAGKHWVMNALGVLAAIEAIGADTAEAASALADFTAPQGRGARHIIDIQGGSFELIDDSYNANPSSMRAAFDVLSLAKTTGGGRRIAVLGDMLELGSEAKTLHSGLAGALIEAADLVFTCGPDMENLHMALPRRLRGPHAEDSTALAPLVEAAIAPRDVFLVKGSLGSRMAVIVETLKNPESLLPRAANGD